MDYLKLLTLNDFNKLTNDDLKKLKKILPELKDAVCDSREWLKNNIENIENIEAANIIKNKVFAGQVTIKLYKVNTIMSDENILKKLMSKELKFNVNNEEKDEEKISIYSTFMLEKDRFIIRVKYNNGLKTAYGHKLLDIKYIDILYHVNEKVLEIRTDIKKSRKIKEYLTTKLNIGTIEGIRLLRIHKNINDFSVAINGHFKKMTSTTDLEIDQLNNDDMDTLGELVLALDDYLLSNNIEDFIEKFETFKFNNKLTFTQAFIAGCSQIGLSVPNNPDSDLKDQVIYKAFSRYLSNQDGYITFISEDESNEVTIRLSTKLDTNTIQFVSSATEQDIKIIVNNVMGEIRVSDIDIKEIKQLAIEIEAYLENPEIKAIRPEHLFQNFNLDEDTVSHILKNYMKNEYILENFEMINRENYEVLKEFNSIDEIRNDIDFMIDKIDSNYEFIENNETFVEEYSEFINTKYVVINHKMKETSEINRETIEKALEAQLNANNTVVNNVEKSSKKTFAIKKFLKASLF